MFLLLRSEDSGPTDVMVHFGRDCFLSSDDTFAADRAALMLDRDFYYSERGSCSNGAFYLRPSAYPSRAPSLAPSSTPAYYSPSPSPAVGPTSPPRRQGYWYWSWGWPSWTWGSG